MLQAVKSDYRQSMTVSLTSVTHRENKQRLSGGRTNT